MSRRREDERYSRYDDRKPQSRRSRSRSRGVDRTPADAGNDMWDAQFSEPGGFPRAPPAPSYSHEAGNSYGAPSAYGSYSGIYDDFPSASAMPVPPQPPSIQWNLPPAPAPTVNPPAPAPPPTNLAEQIKKEAAIESEVRHQKAALAKQREEYVRKANTLRKELETLKDQRDELRGDAKRSPSPDSKRFLKENAKLQLEIQNKLKTINNVVDMLNGIIGPEAAGAGAGVTGGGGSDGSPDRERSSKRKSRSPTVKDKKFNYVYYDPEMHWCRICNHFPPTAKDYLNHLHSPQHHKAASAHLEAPWHGKPGGNEALPTYPSAPTKRTPIRGLQFFVPSTAWYCKLCDQWIGDLHCASAHLKSVTHSRNYTNFVEQNPHWETDWMSDRQKAFEKHRTSSKVKPEEKSNYTAHTITFDKDGFTKKKKETSETPGTPERRPPTGKKEKKKSKRRRSTSSSSSSSSDASRVKDKKGNKKSREPKKRDADESDEKMIAAWMSSLPADKLSEKDRKLLENIKNSMSRARDTRPEQRREREPEQRRERERQHEKERVGHVAAKQDTRENKETENSKEARSSNGTAARSNKDKEPAAATEKKPELKKMPFIGKMPVFKTLTKSSKAEEQKEAEQKRREEEAVKRKRQEMDVEIQRKVAEFKLKIKQKAEQKSSVDLAPPGVALPTSLGGAVPPLNFTQPPPPLPAGPAGPSAPAAGVASFPQTVHRVQKNPVLVSGPAAVAAAAASAAAAAAPKGKSNKKGPLHRDFQEALDIIFPSEARKMEPTAPPEPPYGGCMQGPPPGMQTGMQPPYGGYGPPPGMMPPQMNPPPLMMGYDFNPPPMFAPPGPPQLYDRQVPLVPPPAPAAPAPAPPPLQHQQQRDSGRSEMEDLAMLGIDAADVGALIR